MSVTDMAVDANGILYRLYWLNLLESVEVRTGWKERTASASTRRWISPEAAFSLIWRRKFVALVLLNPHRHSYPAVDGGSRMLPRSLVNNTASHESLAGDEGINISSR